MAEKKSAKSNKESGSSASPKTKKTGVKTPAVKKTAKKSAVRIQASTAVNNRGSRGPLYVLVIMALLAVIAFTVNKLLDQQGMPGRHTALVEKTDQQKEKKESAGKEKTAADLPEKIQEKKFSGTQKDDQQKSELVRSVRLYYLLYNEKNDRVEISSVLRKVYDENYIEKTLYELLSGPGRDEKAKGYLTALPPNLKIRDVIRKGPYLTIDFNSAIEEGAGAGIILNRLDQIIYTATQFEGITGVYIKINGRVKSVIGSDGVAISGPLRRK
jgi:spore germination protein GerM